MRKYYLVGLILTVIIGIAIGIGARREAKLSSATAALENSNAYLARTNTLLDSVLENMPHGVCMFDSEQRLIVSNQRYGEMYRLTPEEIRPGTPARAILEARAARKSSAKDAEYYIRNTFATLARSEPYSTINELQDGRIFAVSHRPMPSGGWVSVHQDVTAQQRNAEQIVHMAHHDALTDLPNRVLFMECMKEAVTRASHHGDTFSIFMLDLNRFKAINDSLGHAVGDALLKEVARRLLAVAGETDKVARLGGDEFALLQVANATYPKDDAVILANRILATVSEPYELNGHQVVVGACLGIAVTPDNGVEADQLLRNADLALYRAKSLGRETYCFFESEMDAQARARHALEVDLRMAISRNEFRLHYQSVVDAATKEICGMEALVRWQHPERGLLYPDSFITLSEETGLIAPLGAWILKQACLDAVSWPTHTKVAVNLSPVQFQTTNLVNIVTTALVESGLPPERLELEITESVLLQDDESNLTALHILRGLGLSIVLDDFGTGYSSLGYLRMFPFNKIKIDRSFVGDLSKNAESAAIVCAITGLARTLNMATTAEGVETEEQFTLLRSAGCTQMQGYLFSRPRPLIDCGLAPAREADSARVA